MSKRPVIECSPESAMNDCAGCRTIDLCKEEIRYQQAAKKTAPVVDAGLCCSCGAMKTKACNLFYTNHSGGWDPFGGKGVKPCPAILGRDVNKGVPA